MIRQNSETKLNLFAIGFYPPRNLTGAEKSGWYTAKQLASLGHRVTIFTEEFKEAKFPKAPRVKTIQIATKMTLDVNPNDYGLSNPNWQIRGLGGDLYYYPFISAITKEIKLQSPDAIIVNWGAPFTSFAVPLARKAGIPIITVLHGSDVHALMQRDFYKVRNVIIRSYKNSDMIIVVADYLKVLLHEMGVMNVRTIRNAIDRREFLPIPPSKVSEERARLNIQENATVFVHVSNLRPVKDPLKIVEAAEIALNKNPNLQFLIAGEGQLRAEMEKSAKEKSIGDKFTFTGKVSASNVRKLLSISDVLLMSSLREGTPIVILEGFAAGKPIIASRVGGIPEIVKHDYNGFLYEQRNTHQFAKQMLRMTDSEIRKRLSRGASQSSKGNSLKKLGRNYEIVILQGIKNSCCPQINSDITGQIWQKLPKWLNLVLRVA